MGTASGAHKNAASIGYWLEVSPHFIPFIDRPQIGVEHLKRTVRFGFVYGGVGETNCRFPGLCALIPSNFFCLISFSLPIEKRGREPNLKNSVFLVSLRIHYIFFFDCMRPKTVIF